MPLPEFDENEQYLINCIKSPKAMDNSSAYMWGYLGSGILIAGFAAYHDNALMMLTSFAIVCGFRIHEERYQSRWLPLWRSIIAKYEAAAMSLGDSAETQS